MNKSLCCLCLTCVPVVVGLLASEAFSLTVTPINPPDYQAAVFTAGTAYYLDAAGTITGIPAALAGGTLLRTKAADATNPGLTVSFNVDVRCEVYACYDSRSPAPDWLSTWVNTDMTISVSDTEVGHYDVYARRFDAGTVNLSANQAEAMYFVVVTASLPIMPRIGWTVLSYDMPYLRETIKQAPKYNINHLEISHDIIMFTYQALQQPFRRADINELIDLAHAYGITSVTVWTHELGTISMPYEYRAADGRPDGNKPGLWTWMQQQYINLFSPGPGCPELDGITLTFSEVSMGGEGREVYLRDTSSGIKHDGFTPTESLQLTINKIQQICGNYGKTLYCRTWAGEAQEWIRDAIVNNGDTAVWMHTKNVGAPLDRPQEDWWYMDSHHPLIGTLPAGYNEMVEFDLGFEWMGRGKYTITMTSYLKEHWNYALSHGAGEGAVARIDRQGSMSYYTANRLNRYALKEILADPDADPAAINLAWCQQYFPTEAVQDIADHYDEPGSDWEGDTRYMTWEVFYPGLSPVTNTQAQNIGYTAIAHTEKHRAQLEIQTSLDTRDGKSDYETLRLGIALPLLDLGGTLPERWGYSNFQPTVTGQMAPDCSINIRVSTPGLNVSSAACEYSTDGGGNWTPWPASATGTNGSTNTETIIAGAVPLNQYSEDQNLIRFHAQDTDGTPYESGALKVKVIGIKEPIWTNFQPLSTRQLTPDCSISVTADEGMQLDVATAQYKYSLDGGNTWISPEETWPNRYECDVLPLADGWSLVEGKTGYESVSDGVLRINDTGINWGDKVKYAKSWNVNPSVGATVLGRMRCTSGGHYFANNILVSDSLHEESLYLKGNGIAGIHQFGALALVDNIDQWHTYRVTIRGEDIYVYLDENPKPLISAAGAFIQGSGTQRLLIGSGASQYTQDIYYDYVYWRTDGAFPPGPWWNAEFEGNAQSGTITAVSVPFNQYSNTLNKIRFRIADTTGQTYVSPVYNVTIINLATVGDFDDDGDTDQEDFAYMQTCLSGSGHQYLQGCEYADFDGDHDVDQFDLLDFLECLSGPNHPPGC